jgi:hypothetical protein
MARPSCGAAGGIEPQLSTANALIIATRPKVVDVATTNFLCSMLENEWTPESVNATRPLIAFAFVKEEFDRTGDLVRGLMPLFEPIFASMAGQAFNPQKFCDAVRAAYGLHLNVLVAEDWVSRFEHAGYLESVGDKYSRSYICKPQSTAPDLEAAEKTQAMLGELVDHVSERLAARKLTRSRSDVEQAIIERLRRPDFLNILLKPELSRKVGSTLSLPGSVTDSGPDIESAIDYILAARLIRMADEQPGQFTVVTNVAAGALVSEVIFNLRQPPAVGQKSGGTLAFIDSPLLLDLFDLADSKQHTYITELIEDLKRTGFRPYTFEHNIAEVRGILKATLDNYSQIETATGTVAYRVRTDQTARSRAQSIRPNLEGRVRALGITIVDMDSFTNANASRFSEEAITDLIGHIRPMGEVFSREIDARSVAGVARQVLGRRPIGTVLDLPAIFITKNNGLAREANKRIIEEGNYNQDAAPPYLTTRQAAGLVWLAIGGDAGGISASQLLANCSLVATPRRDVLSTVYKTLKETDAEAAKEFEVLMSEDRCAHYVMDFALGDAALVTADNAFELLEQVKAKAVEDIRRLDQAKFDEELAAVRSEAAGTIEQQKAEFEALERIYEQRQKDWQAKSDALEAELGKSIDAQAEQAKQIAETKRSIDEMEEAALTSCLGVAQRETAAIRMLVICGAALILAAAGYATNLAFAFVKDARALLFIGAVYAVITFVTAAAFGWVAPDYLFAKHFAKLQKYLFHRELRRRGIARYLDRWEYVAEGNSNNHFQRR